MCEDIAKELGTVGFMKDLQRVRVGDFSIDNSLKISEIDSNEKLEKNFISIEKFFYNKESIELDDIDLKKFLNGVKIHLSKPNNVYRIYFQDRFVGIGEVVNNTLKRDIVI